MIPPAVRDRMDIFRTALMFVPRRSRFREITADCMHMVEESSSWLDAYRRINGRYGKYRHCQVYQEIGTVINSVCFAKDANECICIQVSQGCDTDCFGKIAGSILGAHLGPGCLSERWIEPFNDEIRTSLANFYDRSLSSVAGRIGRLHTRIG
jgi:ADP-ribosylglycohydrolase